MEVETILDFFVLRGRTIVAAAYLPLCLLCAMGKGPGDSKATSKLVDQTDCIASAHTTKGKLALRKLAFLLRWNRVSCRIEYYTRGMEALEVKPGDTSHGRAIVLRAIKENQNAMDEVLMASTPECENLYKQWISCAKNAQDPIGSEESVLVLQKAISAMPTLEAPDVMMAMGWVWAAQMNEGLLGHEISWSLKLKTVVDLYVAKNFKIGPHDLPYPMYIKPLEGSGALWRWRRGKILLRPFVFTRDIFRLATLTIPYDAQQKWLFDQHIVRR